MHVEADHTRVVKVSIPLEANAEKSDLRLAELHFQDFPRDDPRKNVEVGRDEEIEETASAKHLKEILTIDEYQDAKNQIKWKDAENVVHLKLKATREKRISRKKKA